VRRPAHALEDLLLGGVVERLERNGKHLAMVVRDGRALDVQLGMSGQVLIAPPGDSLGAPTHLHVAWTLDDGATIGFRDPRRFGGLWPSPGLEELRAGRWAALGPDALAIEGDVLRGKLAGSRRAVKVALLDQGVLAGLGNIYVAEALFDAGIRPTRLAGRVTPAECSRLAAAIRRVLRSAIDAGGSTLRDYVNARGEPGGFQRQHKVYGRGGLACIRCGQRLRSRVIGQRASVWCPMCQR
jgi:formamidopyrimidine-DNA glycosylase